MNYLYMFPNFDPDRWLDFSREQLEDIDENGLNEVRGIRLNDGTPDGDFPPRAYNAIWKRAGAILSEPIPDDSFHSVDWSNNGAATSTSIKRNINLFGFPECNNEPETGGTIANLPGRNDWRFVNLQFHDTGNFAGGVSSLNSVGENMGDSEFDSDSQGTNDGTLTADTTFNTAEPLATLNNDVDCTRISDDFHFFGALDDTEDECTFANNLPKGAAEGRVYTVDEDPQETELDNDGDGLTNEDPPGDADGDGRDNDDADCTGIGGSPHFFGAFDETADECFLDDNTIRADREDSVDEDGSDQVDNDNDGLFSEDPTEVIKYSYNEGAIEILDASPSNDIGGPDIPLMMGPSVIQHLFTSNGVLEQIVEHHTFTGEAAYEDLTTPGVLGVGDRRIAQPPIDPLSGTFVGADEHDDDRPYPLGSIVAAGDADLIGDSLIGFVAGLEMHVNEDQDGVYDTAIPPEGIYSDNGDGVVSAGDTRLVVNNFIYPDAAVALGDTDETKPLVDFASSIVHVDNGAQAGLLDRGFRVVHEMFMWDINGDGTYHTTSDSSGLVTPACFDDDESTTGLKSGVGRFPFGLLANDGDGNVDELRAAFEVINVNPSIDAFSATSAVTEVSTDISATADYTDPGPFDTHAEDPGVPVAGKPGTVLDWDSQDFHLADDQTPAHGTAFATLVEPTFLSLCVPDASAPGTVDATHQYTEPGIYTLRLTVEDKDGGSDTTETEFVIIVDKNGNPITGSGHFNSDKKDFVPNPGQGGKTNFSFDIRYLADGSIQSSFNASMSKGAKGFEFLGTSGDWLVVSGARGIAQGTGTLSHDGGAAVPGYTFLLFSTDNDPQPKGDPVDVDGYGGTPDENDRIRFVIFDPSEVLVYDNMLGEDADIDWLKPLPVFNNGDQINKGSISVHKSSGSPSGDPPQVLISSPADSSEFDSDVPEAVQFTGAASDPEDGDLTASLIWTSDVDGQIGTGGSFSINADLLSLGSHDVTASVTDSDGNTDTDMVTIVITGGAVTDVASVQDPIDFSTKAKGKHLVTTVHIVNSLGQDIVGATFTFELEYSTDGVSPFANVILTTGTTASDGDSFQHNNADAGFFKARVSNVVIPGGVPAWDTIIVETTTEFPLP